MDSQEKLRADHVYVNWIQWLFHLWLIILNSKISSVSW